MTAHTAEFFTLDEVNRLKIIQEVIDRRLTTQMAAQRLGITDRQCRRLLARYREDGPLGMTNRRRGKSSNNQLPQGLAVYALNIIRERYNDFGPVPRKQRAPKIQQPRYRRAQGKITKPRSPQGLTRGTSCPSLHDASFCAVLL